jgi:hypothetical protein
MRTQKLTQSRRSCNYLRIHYNDTSFPLNDFVRRGLGMEATTWNTNPMAQNLRSSTSFEAVKSSPKPVLSRDLPIGSVAPVFIEREYSNIPWSDKTRVLEKSDGIRIYHNYTTFIDSRGTRQTRYLRAEHIWQPRHLLSRRGFSANPDIDIAQVRYNIEKPTDRSLPEW